MHVDMTQIGDIMRSAREAKGLSQVALAEQLGITERTVISLEKNQRNPTYEVLYRLVHTLDISADLIFFPNRVPLTTEQDQFIQEFIACNDNERRIVMSALQSLIRSLRQCAPEKQS